MNIRLNPRGSVLILAIIAMLMSFAAPASAESETGYGKGSGNDDLGYYDEEQDCYYGAPVDIVSVEQVNRLAVVTFETDYTVCPGSVTVSAHLPWYFKDGRGARLQSNVDSASGTFTVSLKLFGDCWSLNIWTTSDHDRSLESESCSQEFRDTIPTFDVWPTVFVSGMGDAEAVSDLANFFNAEHLVVQDNQLTDRHIRRLKEAARYQGNLAVIVGGTGALSDELMARVQKLMQGDGTLLVRRVSGPNRYETLKQLNKFLPDNRGYGGRYR